MLTYLGIALFTALFGAVYELFSHEVYSYYMIYAFAVPLVLGVLPSLLCLVRRGGRARITAVRIWMAGVITLTIGSVFQGVLEIYGTTNKLTVLYLIAGIVLLLIAAFLHLLRRNTADPVRS